MDPSDRIKASLRNIYSLVQCFFILLFPRKHGKNFHDDVFIYMTFAGWWTFSFRWTLYGEPVKSGLSGLKYSIFTHFFFHSDYIFHHWVRQVGELIRMMSIVKDLNMCSNGIKSIRMLSSFEIWFYFVVMFYVWILKFELTSN